MHQNNSSRERSSRARKRNDRKRIVVIASLILLVTAVIGGTIAFLLTNAGPLTNTFTPSSVSTEITEEFDGKVKSNVNAMNTGDTEVYIRIRLVTYRVNDAGERIGGTAQIPEFTPGENWVKYDEYYYYTLPVAPNEKPAANLIDKIALTEYDDADGGKQVVEVLAEAIQSDPAAAVNDAWGVSISQGSVTPYSE